MKGTIEISREKLLEMVIDGVAGEFGICSSDLHQPRLELSKTSRGKHVLMFETRAENPRRVDNAVFV